MTELMLGKRIHEFSRVIENSLITNQLHESINLELGLNLLYERLNKLKIDHKNLYILGNGGSAGVASHAATDFFNVAKIRATTLHESSLLTCMSNDFGYEHALAMMLDNLLNSGDMVVLISSSGNSMNMRNAAKIGREKGVFLITLTGFSSDNSLRKLGDINIWLDSRDYGFVEVGHQFILHNMADRFNSELTT